MALPTIDSVTTYESTDGVTPFSFEHTASGTGRYLIVMFSTAAVLPIAVSYGGYSMKPLDAANIQNGSAIRIYGLVLPPGLGGPQPVRFAYGSIGVRCLVVAVSLNGVDPQSQYWSPENNRSTVDSSNPSVTVPNGASGGLVISACLVSSNADATITPGGSQQSIAFIRDGGYGQTAFRVTTSTVASNTFTLNFDQAWATFGVALKPLGMSGTPPIPGIKFFDRAIETYVRPYATAILADYASSLAANFDPLDAGSGAIWGEHSEESHYYDGPESLDFVSDYLGETDLWLEASWKQFTVWNNAFVINLESNGTGVPGYKVFTGGAWKVFLRQGFESARNYCKVMRDAPAYSDDGSTFPLATLERELAYHMRAHITCARLGFPPRATRYDALRERCYAYHDYWFVDEGWRGVDIGFQPFIQALRQRTMILDYEEIYQDTRLVPALQIECTYHDANAWHDDSQGWKYNINPDAIISEGGLSLVGSPSLNNLICPTWMWLAKMLRVSDPTAAEAYATRSDQAFAGLAVNGEWESGGSTGKGTNQSLTWIRDYFTWRQQYHNPDVLHGGKVRRVT